MSKKPTTNEKLQFALTHTPAPLAVKLKFRAIRGRLLTVYALLKVPLSIYAFLSPVRLWSSQCVKIPFCG